MTTALTVLIWIVAISIGLPFALWLIGLAVMAIGVALGVVKSPQRTNRRRR